MRRQVAAIARLPLFLGLMCLSAVAGWELAEVTAPPAAKPAERVGQAASAPLPAPMRAAPSPIASARASMPAPSSRMAEPAPAAPAIAWLITGEDVERSLAARPAPHPPAHLDAVAALGLGWLQAGDPDPFPAASASAPATASALLHLASYHEEADARRGWEILVAQANGHLDDARPVLRAVTLPKGRFLRLLAELPPDADPAARCADLAVREMFCNLVTAPEPSDDG